MTDTSAAGVLAAAVHAYVAAWNEPGAAARGRLLERSFAADGSYTDPAVRVSGRAALAVHARRFADRWPGARIALTSGIDEHGGSACFTWRVCAPGGEVLREGIDFVTLGDDGRLTEVRGFFGGYHSPCPA